MKRHLKFYGLLLFATTCIAQNYHITDFLPDSLKTWQIYGTLNTNVGNNTEKYKYNLEKKDIESSNLVARLNPGVTFQYKTISRRREWSFLSGLSPAFNVGKSTEKRNTNDDSVWSIRSNYSSTPSQQYAFNNHFVMTDYFYKKIGGIIEGMVYLGHSSGNTESDVTNKTEGTQNTKYNYQSNCESISNYLSAELSPGISCGRIFNGNYAAKAEELLIELRRMNCLKRELTPAEFHALAQRILKHAERYHYDLRIRRMEALQDIIDYLSSIGTLDEIEIPAILTINDTYAYSPFDTYPRTFGMNFYFKPRIGFDNSNSDRECHSTSEYWIPSIGSINCDSLYSKSDSKSKEFNDTKYVFYRYSLEASYHKIQSWHFWYNAGLNFTYHYHQENQHYKSSSTKISSLYPDSVTKVENKQKGKSNYHNDYFTAYINIYYQFNSRSILHLPLRIFYQFYRYRADLESAEGDTDSDKIRYYETNFSFSPVFTYYLSPKWSIQPSLSVQYKKNRDAIDKITSQNFSYAFNFSTTYYW